MISNNKAWRCRVKETLSSPDPLVYLAKPKPGGEIDVVTAFMFTTVAENEVGPDPDPRIFGSSRNFLQVVLDAAWGAGMRPTGFVEAKPAQPAQEAVERHLEDLRKIAFQLLDFQTSGTRLPFNMKVDLP